MSRDHFPSQILNKNTTKMTSFIGGVVVVFYFLCVFNFTILYVNLNYLLARRRMTTRFLVDFAFFSYCS